METLGFSSQKSLIYSVQAMISLKFPPHSHDPPHFQNQLFQDFKLEFTNSIGSNIEFYKDITKSITQITNLTILSNMVEKSEKNIYYVKVEI